MEVRKEEKLKYFFKSIGNYISFSILFCFYNDIKYLSSDQYFTVHQTNGATKIVHIKTTLIFVIWKPQ